MTIKTTTKTIKARKVSEAELTFPRPVTHCTGCGREAHWTPDNEGYSSCCNEVID